MKKIFYFKEAFYSFMGGIVSSLACTILYEAINKIADIECITVSYILEWCAGLMMCVSCVCLLLLASKLGNIENKFNTMLDNTNETDELWFRAIRAIAEKNIQQNVKIHEYTNSDILLNREADKIYCKLVMLLLMGCFSFLIGIVILVISKVV